MLRNILYLHLILNDLICFCIYPHVSHIEVSNALCFMCLYMWFFFFLNDQLLLLKFCGFQCLKKFLEQSVGLILAILESQQEASCTLVPSLMKLGLPSLLINLLGFEMSRLTEERVPERCDLAPFALKG